MCTEVKDVVTRPPYRCAVGLMTKTDEVSEQGCLVNTSVTSVRSGADLLNNI
jgi:hypothetical protein